MKQRSPQISETVLLCYIDTLLSSAVSACLRENIWLPLLHVCSEHVVQGAEKRCSSLLPLHCPYHMPHISSKRSERPLINQRIAELISRGKLPKSLWPRVHVGPGGAYLLRALICPSAHVADSSSLRAHRATCVNPFTAVTHQNVSG
ncbi:uncharacterized [Tachysurus ichikawai]